LIPALKILTSESLTHVQFSILALRFRHYKALQLLRDESLNSFNQFLISFLFSIFSKFSPPSPFAKGEGALNGWLLLIIF
jgi:hypothetical protein